MYPFENFYNAIGYFLTKNPARHKFINHIEPEKQGRNTDTPYYSNEVLFYTVCSAIIRMEAKNDKLHTDTFWFFYKNRDKTRKDVADYIGKSRQSVARWIEKCEQDLCAELVDMKLLDPYELEKMTQ